MSGPVGSKLKKVSGKSTGRNATFIKSGYAAGPVPEAMVSTKTGLTNHVPYSGPPVATQSHSEA